MNSYYMNAIISALAVTLGLVLLCLLIAVPVTVEQVPAYQGNVQNQAAVQQTTTTRIVTQDACAANSAEELIAMLEFAMTATEDDLEAVTFVGIMNGMLWYFEPGDVVFPTGQGEYYYAVDGTLKVIQVTSPSISGEWWMFEMQTR